jgi:hypothetical protein
MKKLFSIQIICNRGFQLHLGKYYRGDLCDWMKLNRMVNCTAIHSKPSLLIKIKVAKATFYFFRVNEDDNR